MATSKRSKDIQRGSTPPARTNGAVVTRLRSENRKLRAALKEAQKQRDEYLRAVYAWTEQQLSREDVDRLMDLRGASPLSAFIKELEAESC